MRAPIISRPARTNPASARVLRVHRPRKEAEMASNPPPPRALPQLANATRVLDPWNYRPDAGWSAGRSLIGYRVEATDGKLGKVTMDNHAQDDSYLVLDTGRIFGSTLVIPAGLVTILDHPERIVYLTCTKEL